MIPQQAASPPRSIPSTIRVFMFTGDGARGAGLPSIRAIIAAHGGVLVEGTTVPSSLHRDNTDLVIFPGGSACKQLNAIGDLGKTLIKKFVESGGGYIGICAGAFAGSGCHQREKFGLRLLPAMYLRHKLPKEDIQGDVILTLENEAIEWSEQAKDVTCWYHNGPLFPAYNLPDGVRALAIVKEGVSGVQRMKRRATIVAGKFGRGNVLLCGPHPEQTPALREFTWRMICSVLPEP